MKKGYFGQWGGAFIPKVLHQTFAELNSAYEAARADASGKTKAGTSGSVHALSAAYHA